MTLDDLEDFARAADEAADEHEPHDCLITPLLRAVSAAVQSDVAAKRGPAQVSTRAYRDNWETLFGGKQPVGKA
jgi:hypothetical protein